MRFLLLIVSCDKLVTFFLSCLLMKQMPWWVSDFHVWQVGTDKDYLASSIAYRLDLHGTAEVRFLPPKKFGSDSMGYDSADSYTPEI